MRRSMFGFRAKALFALLALSLVSFAVITYVAIFYIGQITEFARLSNVSLGNTAADTSSAALVKQNEDMVYQRAADVARQVQIYLAAHPELSGPQMSTSPEFASIALQTIGKTGYTFLYEKQTGIMRVHPNRDLINFDMHNWQKKGGVAAWWTIFSASLDGSSSSGYYVWEEKDGTLTHKYMSLRPVEGTNYMIAATMYQDEFMVPSQGIRDEISAAALSTSEYIAQQKAAMYRVFAGVIAGLLAIVAGLAFWLSRMITGPILALTNGSKIIAAGNFNHRVDVKTGDEIEQLAEQYNSMASSLKESYANLEEKVERRTAELREANTQLQKEINRREEIQLALRTSEIKYRHLVEKANCIILEMDTEGKVIFFNKFGQEFFGYNESDILGRSVVGTIVPVQDSSGKDLNDMIRDIVLHPDKYTYNENENIRRNGERVWVVWLNQPIYDKDSRLSGVLCIGMDRTELKQAEEQREKQAKEGAAAAERNRLARDLHDAVSQTLFSASLIADVLPRLWERNPDEGRRRLAEIRQLTRGALAEMRTLLLELRPSALMESELGLLLRQLGESITGRARIPVTVEVNGEDVLPEEVKVVFYRIAQEALNNVAKHSGASQVKVNLTYRPGEVELNIIDNGKGFNSEVIPPDSLGLGIMRERAKTIGATLNIESITGEGTRVTVLYSRKTTENSAR
jgi:PAS domain S-box-containing protein